MIIETKLENGFIEYKSDKDVCIKNEQTEEEGAVFYEMSNEVRVEQGLEPYSFIETDKENPILEKLIEDGFVRRSSKNGYYILNNITGFEYDIAIDIPNEERIRRGLTPYTYSETERRI